MSAREKELAERIKELEAKVNALEAKHSPPVPFVPDPPTTRYDPTAGMSIPRSARAEMIAIGNSICPDLAGDRLRSNSPSSFGEKPGQPNPPRRGFLGSGTVPIPDRPPGSAHVDRLLDHADAVDRAERIRKAALGGGG